MPPVTVQPALLAPEVSTGDASAVNLWGFIIEPWEGKFIEMTDDGCEISAVGNGRFYVTISASKQTIPEGEWGTIDHRFLVDKDHRERLELKLQRFCRRRDIPWRTPHWRLVCVRGSR